MKRLQDVRFGLNLSVSHLAEFVATIHWTTSFLAWVECTDRGFRMSRKKYNPSRPNVSKPQIVVAFPVGTRSTRAPLALDTPEDHMLPCAVKLRVPTTVAV